MTRGYPDFGSNVGTTPEGKFLQRLSFPPIWLLDDFESPVLKWEASLGGAVLDSTPASGSAPAHMYFGSTGLKVTSISGGVMDILRTIGAIPFNNHVAFSMFYMFTDKTTFKNSKDSFVPIGLVIDDGTNTYDIKVSHNPNNNKWYVFDDVTRSLIEVGEVQTDQKYWHFLKVTIDPIAGTYLTLQIDSKVFDISTIVFGTTPSTNFVRTTLILAAIGATAKVATYYLDNYKITYGES